MLQSARFIGDPVLEACLAGAHRMQTPEQGAAVQAVQRGLLDLGYELPVYGDDGFFGSETGEAVTAFKADHAISPDDPIVGQKTMQALDQEWALPFADRDEWLSWQTRPIPEWNFTRGDELNRRNAGAAFTFSPVSSWLPVPFSDALLAGIAALLDPYGSPDGPLTPPATWGASPLDLFHCHVVVDHATFSASPVFQEVKLNASVERRLKKLREQADKTAPRDTPAWTTAYRDLLLAPGTQGEMSVRDLAAKVLNEIRAESVAQQRTVSLVWHSFEAPLWRPVEVGSDDPRRSWWSVASPSPSGISHTPFSVGGFGSVTDLFDLAFLVDENRAVTVMAETLYEAAAAADLPMARIRAEENGQPYP